MTFTKLTLLSALGLGLSALAPASCGDDGSTSGETATGTETNTETTTDATSAGPSTAGQTGSGTMSAGTMGGSDASSGDPTSATNTGTSNTTNTTNGTTGAVDDCPIFEPDIVPIFEISCGAGNNMCHSRVAYAANSMKSCRGWLSLEDEAIGSLFYDGPDEGAPTGCPDMPLLERLTQLDAWQCEEFDPRVRYPCDAEASYITRKIDGGPYCKNAMGEVTQPMPPGVEMDPEDRATIMAWIDAGAPTLAMPECNAACNIDPTDDPTDGMIGEPPTASIFHPGDAEERKVDVPIPFIGEAVDPEDGPLGGTSLVWESDLEGLLGDGGMFDKALTQLGTHTITLTATDADDNIGTDSIQIIIIP